MKKLTEKQAKFAANKVAGMTNEAAVIAAGYSPAGAKQAANTMLKLPHIKAAIAEGKRALATAPQDDTSVDMSVDESENPVLRPSYDSPLAFMEDCMNNPRLPAGLRFEAAKQALPYRHGKVGPEGKKEKIKRNAEKITEGADNDKQQGSNFTPMRAPLRAVK